MQGSKGNHDGTQCAVIEQLDSANKTNLMHSQIRLVTGSKWGSNSTTCIEDNKGNIIMEKEKIPSRWYEYIGELYNDDKGDMIEIVAEVELPFTPREHVLRGTPMKKSPDPDDITTKMRVDAGDEG